MRLILGIMLAFLAFGIAAQAGPCSLKRIAQLDMEMDDTGRITVPVTINGVEKRMMVDTGAQESMITAKTTQELKLEPHLADRGRGMAGFGGTETYHVVTLAEFGIGPMKGQNYDFFIEPTAMESAGLLGEDFLKAFDLDFDFAHAKLNLISPDHCPGQVVYWTQDGYGTVPFKLDNHINLPVKLDGQDVSTILDTGAADTMMSLERAARLFDLDKQALVKSRHYPFKTMSFGEISVKNPAIDLVPDKESQFLSHYYDSLHMIVGMGVLRRLHLYISYREKMLYVTPATQY